MIVVRFCAVLLLFLASCASGPDAPRLPLVASVEPSSEVRVGDSIAFDFIVHDELSGEALVDPDGTVMVPIAGSIPAAGIGLSELEADVVDMLQGRVRVPAVRVSRVSRAARRVYVGGAVRDPGVVEIVGDRFDIAEAIGARGGPDLVSAELSRVVVSRLSPDGTRRAWSCDLEASLIEGRVPELIAGDVVVVPNSSIVGANIAVDQYITRMIPGLSSLGFSSRD